MRVLGSRSKHLTTPQNAPIRIIRTRIRTTPEPSEKMAITETKLNAMIELEDYAHFRAELVELSRKAQSEAALALLPVAVVTTALK